MCVQQQCVSQTVESDEFPLVGSRDVADYLELTDSQVSQLAVAVKAYRTQVNSIRENSSLSAFDARQRYNEALRAKNDAIRKLLIPSQVEALKAFRIFLMIKREGLATSIARG